MKIRIVSVVFSVKHKKKTLKKEKKDEHGFSFSTETAVVVCSVCLWMGIDLFCFSKNDTVLAHPPFSRLVTRRCKQARQKANHIKTVMKPRLTRPSLDPRYL